VKKGFQLVPVLEGDAGSIYTIQFERESPSEFDKFLANEMVRGQKASFERLVSKLREMSNEYGFEAGLFKVEEGKRRDYVVALIEGKIRLYCLRIDDTLIVVGNGGVKDTRTYQDDPHLNASVEDLQMVHDRLMKRIYSGRILVDRNNGALRGSLNFYKD
jgi:hypothetical protein